MKSLTILDEIVPFPDPGGPIIIVLNVLEIMVGFMVEIIRLYINQTFIKCDKLDEMDKPKVQPVLVNLYVFYLITKEFRYTFFNKNNKKRNNENVSFIKFPKYNLLKPYHLYVKMRIF